MSIFKPTVISSELLYANPNTKQRFTFQLSTITGKNAKYTVNLSNTPVSFPLDYISPDLPEEIIPLDIILEKCTNPFSLWRNTIPLPFNDLYTQIKTFYESIDPSLDPDEVVLVVDQVDDDGEDIGIQFITLPSLIKDKVTVLATA